MSSPVRKRVDVEVRYAETDQMGIVHHSNYLVWFELARTALCAESGVHYSEVERRGHFLTVTGSNLVYRKAARYSDTVAVECWLVRLGSRGMRFGYEVRRGDDRLANGTTDHVWVDRETARPCRMPEYLLQPFERLAGER